MAGLGTWGPGTWGPGTLGPGTLGTGTLGAGTLGTGTCELDRPGNFWSGRKDAELPRLVFARVWKGQLAQGPPTGTLGARLWLWADEPGRFAGLWGFPPANRQD